MSDKPMQPAPQTGEWITQASFTKPDRYILCPGCGKNPMKVDHLHPGQTTRWSCDRCGAVFALRVQSNGVDIDLMLTGEKHRKKVVVLKSLEPVSLVLHTWDREYAGKPKDQDEIEDSDQYYYNEHTCPTNYTRYINVIIDHEGDTDPHGVFQWVSSQIVDEWPDNDL